MTPPVEADLHGRTALVTGGNSGIGKETARALARLGARVVIACRDEKLGAEARADLAASTGNAHVELMLVDFADQGSVRGFVRAFLEKHEALHVLVNNAGIWSERRRETRDGIEAVWATNMLGYFLTTALFLPLLKRSAPARIVSVASALARDLDLDDVEWKRRPYSGVGAYAQSKQANRMWTWTLARRLEGSGVTANAMHPGSVNTAIFGKGGGALSLLISIGAKLFAKSAGAGADTVAWLAAAPEAAAASGKFFIDRKEVRCRFRNPEREEKLWALCERMAPIG